MDQERGHFTDEFKTEAIALLAGSGRRLVEIAGELGISPSMLRNDSVDGQRRRRWWKFGAGGRWSSDRCATVDLRSPPAGTRIR